MSRSDLFRSSKSKSGFQIGTYAFKIGIGGIISYTCNFDFNINLIRGKVIIRARSKHGTRYRYWLNYHLRTVVWRKLLVLPRGFARKRWISYFLWISTGSNNAPAPLTHVANWSLNLTFSWRRTDPPQGRHRSNSLSSTFRRILRPQRINQQILTDSARYKYTKQNNHHGSSIRCFYRCQESSS